MEHLMTSIGSHLFLVFGLLAVAGAVSLVFSKNAVHSVVGFLFSMLSVAACYLCLSAEFLAVAQLLVYAGGIVVLFLFVVMLVELTKYKESGLFQRQTAWAVAAVTVGAVAFITVFWKTVFGPSATVALTLDAGLAQGLDVATQNSQAVSRGMFAGYLLPFEILSVILLVALVGAVTLAKKERV
ncbi:NADH-quinone oxidoreductase subunit J family protein [Mesoterricola sediminis]|uniref:NADH-quinone oxidoreductase subunit J n=1 Tax=Mesoterricola sediminis TaxID=2927980 RepID=A0AA48H097_9BACT|nr:NADH-quinone oxidoreductase subunit J [Mesoterricola sediminis]BDU78865.1 NADH-quinone oxidoreductase subunit J [Mesoterricola sediminis]